MSQPVAPVAPPQEIERRFLLRELPDLAPFAPSPLSQGWLVNSPAGTARLRQDGERRLVTVKTGAGLVRQETEAEIGPELFAALWPLCATRLTKDRHRLPLPGGLTAELDRFTSPGLAGHRQVEVEFADAAAAAAFVPPAWFGAEVTTDGRYTNAALAKAGRAPSAGRQSAVVRQWLMNLCLVLLALCLIIQGVELARMLAERADPAASQPAPSAAGPESGR